jgi:predicted AlkP superfamily pyrophosphatase or phosphodiesterase
MARRRPLVSIVAAGAVVAVAAAAQPGAAAPAVRASKPLAKPDKVVIIVVDSLSKEIVDKYDMANVKELMADYVDTPRGYLGHTGSVTVVSHNVITSGQLPKHMGWTSEGYRDVGNVLGDEEPANPGNLYITSDATTDLTKLQNAAGYPKLDAYLDAASPGSKQFVISPKGYAGYAFGSSATDSIITFSSATCVTGDPPVTTAWRRPGGVNPPSYLSTPADCSNRFWVHSGYSGTPNYNYDTDKLPAILYPLDSDRYATGHDPAHLGGDVWAADAAIAVMDNEPNWNGIFVTLPGVDKAAHMWGGVNDPGPTTNPDTGEAGDPMTHLAAAAATADEQVGKIMAELDELGELDNTLVVLTADHGSVSGVHFYGKQVATRDYGFFNWYYGNAENDPVTYDQPQDALLPLIGTGKVGLSYNDSMLSEWLNDQSRSAVNATAAVMKDLPGVTAVWRRNGSRYQLASPVRWDLMTTKAERDWFSAHAQELVDTQAAPYGPDLIATLPDNTTYSVAGDHGGIQRAAQLIPIVFAGAGLPSTDITAPVRSVDIMPTILKAMGIAPTFPMDGIAYRLPTQ